MGRRYLRVLVASLVIASARSAAIGDPAGHDAEIEAFATIMAVTRTAAERCPGVTIDEAVIVAAKDRLRVVDADYFAFRAKAHGMAEALENDAVVVANPSWCSEALGRFGSNGTELKGALRR